MSPISNLDIQTSKGVLQGFYRDDARLFLGIPYAKAARFERSLPPDEWNGVRMATSSGSACPQQRTYYDEEQDNPFYWKEFREGLHFTYDENCLNLNIYAPAVGEKIPVILFFHGGSFLKGSSDEKPFDGAAYARNGTIFIAANYRINIFGFGVFEGSSPNLALWDMWAALKWVKENISAFGGDPNNITLMGQSAGAIAIHDLLYNSEFRRDVQGAVLLSGGGFRKGLLAPHSERWIRRFCSQLKGNLKTLSTHDLFEEYFQASKKSKVSVFAICPCYDEELIRRKDHRKTTLPPLVISVVHNDILGPILPYKARQMQKETPTYIYRFKHALPGGGKDNFHSCDLWYVLGSLSHSWRPFSASDYLLSEKIVSAFSFFAKNHRFSEQEPLGFDFHRSVTLP